MKAERMIDTENFATKFLASLVVVGTIFLAGTTSFAAQIGVTANTLLAVDPSGNVEFFIEGNGINTASFAAWPSEEIPPDCSVNLEANREGGNAEFIGDYIGARVTAIAFNIRMEGSCTTEISMYLVGGSGRVWRYDDLVIPARAGEWAVNRVSTEMTKWILPGSGLSAWEQDLADVERIGFTITQRGGAAQTCSVQGLTLLSDYIPTQADMLRRRLQDHFGPNVQSVADLDALQLSMDSDRDGRTDLDQIMAGEDPGLAVEILSLTPDEGATIGWPYVQGKSYTVLRMSEISSDRNGSVIVTNWVPGISGYRKYPDSGAIEVEKSFYQVIKRNDLN